MDIYDFLWDPSTIEKIIIKHGVTPEEAEQVFQDKLNVRSHKGVYIAMGRTLAGRQLLVVFKPVRVAAIKIITAREMTGKEKRMFRE